MKAVERKRRWLDDPGTGGSEDKGQKCNRVKLSPVEGVDNEVHYTSYSNPD